MLGLSHHGQPNLRAPVSLPNYDNWLEPPDPDDEDIDVDDEPEPRYDTWEEYWEDHFPD